MIEIKGLTKEYDKTVLNQVSYTFEKNKIYVIKGISGCGKTTLLNILGGLEKQYGGEYYFEGKDTQQFKGNEKEKFKASIGYIFQSSLLMSKLSVMENLCYINNDKELIQQYAKQLNVEKLLDKRPEQLSGGERQRIAVIRTLIQNPKVIIADEPTASLDKINSKEIAGIFATLRNENRIIIIATHEKCFDDIADEIIHLGYGVIKDVEKKNPVHADDFMYEESGENKGNSLKVILPLIFKRHKEKFRLSALLPMIFIITAILICFAVQHNFKSETIRRYMGQYPSEMIVLMWSGAGSRIEAKYGEIDQYESYSIRTDEYVCSRLLPKEDSVLAYGNLIKYGKFPEKEYEVLVSYWTAVYMESEETVDKCIDKKINIEGTEYTIVGVVADIDNDPDVDRELYNSDVVYLNEDVINVYIPYDTIKQNGEIGDSIVTMAKVEGLYEDEEMYNDIKYNINMGYISNLDTRISEMQQSIDSVAKVVFVAFIVVAFMAALFIKNDIEVDLFYRRKELGYLQIFGVRKKTIWLQLVFEKMIKNTISMLIAVMLYYILAIAVKNIWDINGFITAGHILAVLGIELGFTLVSVLLPIRKYMRKDVLELI